MVKRLVQIIIILVLLFISFCLYLSIYGLNTNKFNDLISKKNKTITSKKINERPIEIVLKNQDLWQKNKAKTFHKIMGVMK